MNVVGSRPDGWWRDRQGAIRALTEELERFASDGRAAVTVVFDGRPFELEAGDVVVFDGRPLELEAGDVKVSFAARRGRDAADDEIVRLVAADRGPGAIRVVTSDAELARRVRERGAEVISAGSFRRLLDERARSSP